MHFMNAEKKEEFEMLAKENEYIERAYDRLSELSEDEVKRLEYEAREKEIRDYDWQMYTSHEDGFKEGTICGYLESCMEFKMTEEEIVKRIMNKYSVDKEMAEGYIKEYYKRKEV